MRYLVCGLLVAVVGCGLAGEQKPKDESKRQPVPTPMIDDPRPGKLEDYPLSKLFTVPTVDGFLDDWRTNTIAASKLYLHQRISVRGHVVKVDNHAELGPFVVLRGYMEEVNEKKLYENTTKFYFPQSDIIEKLAEHNEITIEGVCKKTPRRGGDTSVDLYHCRIVLTPQP